LNRSPNISIAPSDQPRTAVLVEVGRDRGPRPVALVAEADLERLELRRPQLRGRDALVLRHVEAESLRIAVQLGPPAAMAGEEAVRRLVVHRERAHLQAEAVDERHGEAVRPREAHRTRLGPQPCGEGLAQRQDASTDALLRLEDDGVVPGARQLPGRDQSGHARAHDHDASRARRPRRQTAFQEREVLVGGARDRHGEAGYRPAPGR
jgi:hypothetical protein